MKTSGSSDENGQSTLEMVLAMVLTLSFSLFFIQLSLTFAWGNYVHYATFMAARAYLSAGTDPQDQKERAKSVIVRMLKRPNEPGSDRFKGVAKGIDGPAGSTDDITGANIGPGPVYDPTTKNFSWMEGVRYTFRSRLFVIPLGGGNGLTGKANQVDLTSESWLSRDPTFSECASVMRQKKWEFDNGC